MDQSADPSPMDQTDKSLDPSLFPLAHIEGKLPVIAMHSNYVGPFLYRKSLYP